VALALGAGTAIAALAGGASAVRAAAHDRSTAGATPGHRKTQPPIPRVSTLGVTRLATLVSYCWAEKLPGGGSHGACVDGTTGHPAHTLQWEPGVQVRVDLGLVARNVDIQATRLGGVGARPSHVIDVKVARIDASGRRWTLRLPSRAKRDTDLLISAQFANGDVEADLGILHG
jgi:hypothetical protein